MALDGNERRELYRKMLNDPATQGETRKYSFIDWEKKLLGDEKAIGKLAQFAVNRNWAIDESDFAERYIPEFVAPPAPKPQAAPVAPPPVEEEPYIPEPQPAIGSPEYDAQLQAQYGGMAPTLGATFGGAPAAFETKAQKKQEQISPAFKAQKLAFEDVPIAEEQRRAQRQFAKATKERQQAALMGGPGFEVEQEKKAKERGYVEGAIDQIGAFAEGGKRIAKNILSTAGYYAQMQAATDPMANLPYEKRQEMMQQASQTMYNNATAAQNTFQNEITKRNIQTSVLQAIEKGQYNRIPESVLYTIGDAAMQIIPSILTFGGSTYMQTLPQAYKDGVEAIAKEKGISPEQVIASGDDGMIVSQLNSGTQSMLELAGAGLVSKGIASKGGYKAMRDWLLSQNVNRRLAQGAALLGVGTGEAATEYGQELTGQIGKTAAASSTTKAFLDKLPKELFTPEAKKQRQEAFVGGMVGGLGLAGGGQAIQSAMDRTLFEAPKIGKATQRADYDVVQTDNKITERNKIAQAMEEAVKANPEAAGQIRQQYQKRINEVAPTDEEVLSAYESLSVLPETEEKNTIRENLEAYMAEKGIQAEPTGMDAGLGELMRREPPVIQTVNAEFPAPVAEESATEELTPEEEDEDLAAFGRELEAIEQAAPVAPAEEELNIVEPDSELSQKILDNGEQVVSRLDAEKRIGDGERLFGFNEQDDSLVELSLQNLGAFPVDTIIAVRPEVIEEAPQSAPEVVAAAPVEEAAPEAPVDPAPKGRKRAAPVTPAPAAPKKEEGEVQQEPRAAQKIAAISPTNLQVFKGVVTKDLLKPKMQGVYFDKANQKIVATDGMNMVVVDRDVKSDVIIDPKTGQVIKETFPDYQTVIPTDYKKRVKSVNINDLIGKLDAIIKGDKERTENAFATITFDGEQVGITPKVLKAGLKALKDLGYETASIEYKAPNKPLLIKTKDGKTLLLTMPTFLREDKAEGAISIGEFTLEDTGRPKAAPVPATETKEGKKAEAKEEKPTAVVSEKDVVSTKIKEIAEKFKSIESELQGEIDVQDFSDRLRKRYEEIKSQYGEAKANEVLKSESNRADKIIKESRDGILKRLKGEYFKKNGFAPSSIKEFQKGIDSGEYKIDDLPSYKDAVSAKIVEETKPPAPSFTSQQSSEAATAFDKAKTSKGFDKKYGKGAYKALSDITKNFEDIMDKVSEKIKQDCII